MQTRGITNIILGAGIVVGGAAFCIWWYQAPQAQPEVLSAITATPESDAVVQPESFHRATPEALRALYLSGWSAGSARAVNRTLGLIDRRDINAVVIDIKDATGYLSYRPRDPVLLALGVGTRRIADLPGLIAKLHARNIYVIGRVAVFQDQFFAERFPDEAFHRIDTGEIWRDYKGIAWLRPDSQKVWDHTIAIAHDAYAQGFDEINLDYVRFPSDGPLAMLDTSMIKKSRAHTIKDFFAYMDTSIRGSRIPLSADIFGLTMSAKGDLGIGQILEFIAPHVDYVAPMIYPSHFAAGSYGYAQPAKHPGEVITRALGDGMQKLNAANIPTTILRPWLQDFDLGAVYTADMVRAQIDASEELGVNSWMLWDPANTYTEEGLPPR